MSHGLMIAVGLLLIRTKQHIMLGAGWSCYIGLIMRGRRRISRMTPTSTLGGWPSKSLYWEPSPPFLPCCVLAVVSPMVLLSCCCCLVLLFSIHFADKQSWDQIVLPSTCDPESRLFLFAFRSSEVLNLLLDLDPYGGCDPLGFSPLFLQKIARILAPKLSVGSSFPSSSLWVSRMLAQDWCNPWTERTTLLFV